MFFFTPLHAPFIAHFLFPFFFLSVLFFSFCTDYDSLLILLWCNAIFTSSFFDWVGFLLSLFSSCTRLVEE
ncbi:hypothetical protein DFJ73DRAFT_877284 [Zopfochytrium polystomum]|nr:hypothetical protein DFJ73DRAFT_877284 [Zopfochytrium polystomum]